MINISCRNNQIIGMAMESKIQRLIDYGLYDDGKIIVSD